MATIEELVQIAQEGVDTDPGTSIGECSSASWAIEQLAAMARADEAARADWATIEDWRRLHSNEFMLQGLDSGEWRLKIINWGQKCERRGEFEGARAEVIQRAAEWCRADDRRAHDDRVEENLELVREAQTTEPAEETG